MRIGGLQKLTLLDYPGKVACTVFLSGCNLRCPYCHNPGLVLPEQSEGSEIRKRRYFPFWNGGKESWTVSASPAGNRRSSRSCRSFSKSFAVLAMPSSWTPTAPTPPCSRRFCRSAFLTMWRWTLRTALLVMRKPAAASTAFPGCGRAPPC